MTGVLIMSDNVIEEVGDPVVPTDAANKNTQMLLMIN